jgi:hypothetical protein
MRPVQGYFNQMNIFRQAAVYPFWSSGALEAPLALKKTHFRFVIHQFKRSFRVQPAPDVLYQFIIGVFLREADGVGAAGRAPHAPQAIHKPAFTTAYRVASAIWPACGFQMVMAS